ncbi:TonB-dependent receptor [Myroides pelagicus]|uniref:TonB-dependent receptor plug domain-containing protein n=1 Tax=Myroides pelagicus TaxID=270914 RepID=A0A7K1GPX9_9FLAO|nr:TonB-dependent receptor [Myroides pelagicus]MEC4112661.1 TonB-dependent receptor [Myroides pelagicus]MTH30965.1 TonB-dependent receptor plug domain-containing protein [Myroides pelagicus]
MKLLNIVAALATTCAVQAQAIKISGTVSHDMTQEPLAFATVSLKDNTIGTNTDINGKYELDLKPGTHTLVFQYLGYTTAEKTITVAEGKPTTFNMGLAEESIELEGVVVQATRSKTRESALLLDQQKAAEIKQHIGSQELARKGVSDVAAAVVKTTGVAKQEGSGTIFVRGLGDRYNSTALNGLPLASNDPEKKNIDLNIFSTDIVEYISIDKTYGVRQYGDMAGANIDIMSKKHTGKDFLEVGIGTNINSNAVSESNFYSIADRNSFGFSKTDIPNNPLEAFTFAHSAQTEKKTPIGSSINLNAGKSFFFGAESSLDLFATVAFGNKFSYKEGLTGSVQAQDVYTKKLNRQVYEYSTNTTAMFNADYKINPKHSIKYNFLFINDSKEANEQYTGYVRDITPENENSETLITRGTYRQDRLFVNQLLGDHKINDQFKIKWGAAYNNVSAQTPDRQQYTFNKNANGDYAFSINSRADNNRYFEDLIEDELAANAAVEYSFGKNSENLYNGKLTVGYNYRQKNRDFKATQFNFAIDRNHYTNVDPNNLDNFFNQGNFENGYFQTFTYRGGANTPNALKPQTYTGDLTIHAGFANVEYRLSDRLSGVIGARFETITQNVEWQTQLDAVGSSNELTKNAFLPSLSLKYELTDLQNLRLAASKTYTLPQFKERALFIYQDVTESKVGNPFVYASDDYNLDLKWEMFPTNDEVYSATVFGKYIQNPINEVTISSAANDISYVNTGDYGYAVGVEIEVRKNLVSFDDVNTNKLTGGLNASWMKTYQELDNEKVAKENPTSTSFTNENSAFTGASDLLLNADISYIKEWGEKNLTATLSYAHFSDKLYALGTQQKGDLVDKAFGMLDFAFKMKFNENFGISLNAKNLLNPAIERKQENKTQDVLVQSYKLGTNLSVGLKYTF